ncbi:MAG: ribosome recycling factor [Candidatus Sungbacteria bacterium RIFCSPLOWO2_01_FULL_47_10]|uniref:Ribosome-recycling factor n=1 Tax=Candidatus Sungbacteria bacterium RIFCSPLOWO2_01_FULL_47_10 TaxID=1802276 RepID=A0A1G2L0D9_9BACT|nr:MAG: ribosome recycling factor [Candidatus Sungbacteria bacterium RIFCSPLOWO2_01_FULL_47_10]
METLKEKLNKVIDHLKSEIVSLRTGRASPALVEDLQVDYYGVKTPLKAVASISTPDPKQIVIQPWDKAALQPIEKAIQQSQLGLNPVVDGAQVRLMLPQLTEERRKDLIKILKQKMEEARISVRKTREEALREVDILEKKKEISEDEKFRKKQDVQKMVDETNKKIEEIGAHKEKEILEG